MSRIYLFVLGILSLGIIFSVGSEAAPSTGTVQVAFILSEFEDQEYQDGHDQDYFEDLAFGETESMWEYFDEVSRSVLNIDGDVFGPYTLDGDAADYGPENQNFVRDSVEIADDDIDYRDYDAVMVIHSGPGEESSGNSDDIWSIHWTTNIETEDNGYEIKRITQAPEYLNSNGERSPLGVWVHEFGHELGLPDLYDTDGSSEGIGHWGVMASGSWTDNGETPAYFSAWCRYWLGWISPIPITDDVNNLVLEPIEDGGDVYLLSIPGNWSGSEEYFLIENRQKMKYDQYLPGEGLLIWHIDDRESNNRDEEHKLVDLEEADGNDDLDHNTNRGDDGDPYTSGSFTKDTYPNSLAYNGTKLQLHPISFASPIAAEVFPHPGGPDRITPFFVVLFPHEFAQFFRSFIVLVFPIRSERLSGLYFSAQDSINHLVSLQSANADISESTLHFLKLSRSRRIYKFHK